MSDSTLYDDDILLWSEQQAAAIRRLRETERGLPNELDIENVAEEIESVGRSELAAVESYLLLIMVHLMKVFVEPDAEAADHWREELVAFSFSARRRYAPSMRQHLDINEIWKEARFQVTVGRGNREMPLGVPLPTICPLALDDLVAKRIDINALIALLERPERNVSE